MLCRTGVMCYTCYICSMESIAHRELRNNSGEILRRVAAGESFAVTNNGTTAALLIPPGGTPLEVLRSAGQARPPRRVVDFGSLRRAKGVSSAEVLADLRGDR